MDPKADAVIGKEKKWPKEFMLLQKIALSCGLTETLKWGCPCYTHNNSNVVLIHGFKEYCAFLFFKGALLKDTNGILIQQTENVQAARQVRFTNAKEIATLSATLKTYIYQAIEVENAGMKVALKKVTEFKMVDEFKKKLDKKPALKKAFEALTPGRQRGYLLHFSAAKQTATREARIEKCTPLILQGKGLND
ncbi:MAG: YdeI/OmpD-associated family protein [Flavihumibacter sp.]|nr:YdeI/OmpD-associated family protein [Flavihumibacter sp.]